MPTYCSSLTDVEILTVKLILQRHLHDLSGIRVRMVMDLAAADLDRVHERIAGRFARAEPRSRVREGHQRTQGLAAQGP
jgi:hypothetical protein